MSTDTTSKERIITVKTKTAERIFGSIIGSIDDLDQVEKNLYYCESIFTEGNFDYPKEMFELMHSQIKSALAELARASAATFFMTCFGDLSEPKIEGKHLE